MTPSTLARLRARLAEVREIAKDTRPPWRVWWFGADESDAEDGVNIDDADEQTIAQGLDLKDAKAIVALVNLWPELDALLSEEAE